VAFMVGILQPADRRLHRAHALRELCLGQLGPGSKVVDQA
jgi:hypothetical protein